MNERVGSGEPYLRVEGLCVDYGSVRVLDDLSLDVATGELVALLGSSGCGKTTLLRAVAGFVPVAAGRIRVAGRDIGNLPPERRNTALVFQSYALWPHMTVAQNIGYGLKVRGWQRERIRARVEEMLALLELPGFAGRVVTELSGGQRQRVALGRALAVEPELLLLDEPLSNLDARIRGGLRHEIRALQQRLGITALHVTHDREEAMVMADRIVVLDRGVIAQAGTPEDLWHNPASPFVATFLGADNVVGVELDHAGQPVAVPDAAPLVAHFRSGVARLVPAAAPVEGALRLEGAITQAAYLGDVWRYGVRVATRDYLVDAPERLTPGEAVAIAIPTTALHLFPTEATRSGASQAP
jgi:ABC-type Fe3+/spermidine/putrescine transport system ATPase subunit